MGTRIFLGGLGVTREEELGGSLEQYGGGRRAVGIVWGNRESEPSYGVTWWRRFGVCVLLIEVLWEELWSAGALVLGR